MEIVNLTLDGCIYESAEFTAEEILVMFLKCSDEKVLDLYHDFERFLEFFSRYDQELMRTCRMKLNSRRS